MQVFVRLDRPGLTDLRARAVQDHIQGVVVTRLDRISRSHQQLLVLFGDLECQHIALYATDEQLETNLTYRYRHAFSYRGTEHAT